MQTKEKWRLDEREARKASFFVMSKVVSRIFIIFIFFLNKFKFTKLRLKIKILIFIKKKQIQWKTLNNIFFSKTSISSALIFFRLGFSSKVYWTAWWKKKHELRKKNKSFPDNLIKIPTFLSLMPLFPRIRRRDWKTLKSPTTVEAKNNLIHKQVNFLCFGMENSCSKPLSRLTPSHLPRCWAL